MRKKRELQSTIFDMFPDHSLGLEYQAISAVLDQHPRILEWVASDLGQNQVKPTGRGGLSVESTLRAGIVKQRHGLSYRELTIHILDSRTYNAFCRLGQFEPSRSALQEGVSKIRQTCVSGRTLTRGHPERDCSGGAVGRGYIPAASR